MDRSLYARLLVNRNPNVWYVAVGGDVTIDKSVRNLQSLERRIVDERLASLIIDYRAATLKLLPPEFVELAKRFRLFVPAHFQIAYLASQRNGREAIFMATSLRNFEVNARAFTDWTALTRWLGCPDAMDPLPRKTVEI
ncbi:MAG: hypothetical protein ACQRW7_11150 [Caulobacterales bacterium]|uniref:hypothetical protein n=1 Tax=Glycocaulis sp. TaxID=1969725 RepID=UPI003F9F197B